MNITIIVPDELQDKFDAIAVGDSAELSVTCESPGHFTLDEVEPSDEADEEAEGEKPDSTSANTDASGESTDTGSTVGDIGGQAGGGTMPPNPAMRKMMGKK